MDDTQIGWLLTTAIVVRTVATPWIAQRADRAGRRVRTLMVLSALATVAFVPFGFVEGFWPLFGLSLAFGILFPPLIPLIDNLTVLAARQHGLRYGRIRLWGSLAFLLAAIGIGAAVEENGPGLVYWVVLCALAAAALLAPLVPASGSGAHRPTAGERPIRQLLGNRSFVAVVAVAGLLQASHAAYYGFSTLHWTRSGIGEDVVGWLWAEGVVAEIVLFAFGSGWAERMGTRRLFLIGGGAAVLRWSVLALSTDVGVLAATNWLHAFSFGATHLAAIGHLQRHVPQAFSSTAQSLLSAVTTGIAMALATSLSAVLFEHYAGGVFWAMGGIALATSLGAVLLGRRPSAA